MDIDLNHWFKCDIDKTELKKLCKKSDLQGFKHMAIYFASLFFFGYLAYVTWGTWWTVLFFLSMEISGGVVMQYGMKQVTGLLLNLNSGMIFFIILLVLWIALNQ